MKNSIAFVLLAAIFSLAGPVSYYGALTVDGNRIKNQAKTTDVQLKGPSFFWSDGIGLPFYTARNVEWFVDTMDISVFRHAMTVQYLNSDGSTGNVGNGDGYLTNAANRAKQIALIDTMVKAAIANDIYVIIDWHSHRAQNEQSAAVEFFTNMATKYRNIPNVIFEIYNEPPMYDCNNWSNISGYMSAVINAIRNTAQNSNLILVGSPQWSSCPNVASSSAANIAYTVHFYAGSHFIGGTQHSNSNTALNSNKAVFASEWGTTNARGDDHVDANSSRQWMSWMNTNKISSCQWSVSDFEGSSIFKSSSSNSVALNNLSESGKLLYEFMCDNTNYNTPCKTDPPSGWPWARSQTRRGVTGNTIKEGDILTWTGTQVGLSAGAEFYNNTQAPTPGLSVEPNKLTFEVPHQLPSTTHIFNYYIKLGNNISKHRITLINIIMGPKATVDRLNVNQSGATNINFSTLGVSHPTTSIANLSVTNPSVSAGTIQWDNTNRRFVYRAPSNAVLNQEVTFTYTLEDRNGITLTKVVTLVLGGTSPIRDLPLPASFGLNSHGSAISVNLAKSGAASLDVFSLTGAKVATLMSGHQNAGSYEFSLNNFAKGVYIVRLKQGSQTQTLRIVR